MTLRQLYLLLSSFTMMLLLGTVYVWGIFRVEVEALYGINATLSGLPYMVSLVSYAITMLIAGRWMVNHRKEMAMMGVIFFAGGLGLSSLANQFIWLLLSYGIFIGVGVGLLYGIPVFMVQKTFSQRIGLNTGIILMGFGLSNTLMTPLIQWLLTFQSMQETFATLAWISLIVLSLCVWPLMQKVSVLQQETQTPPTFNRTNFFSLYLVFVFSLISGLTIIGLSYRIGFINYNFDLTFMTISLAVFGLLNGLSRPLFGFLVDRFGFFKITFFSLWALVISGLLSLFNSGQYPILFAISYGAFWFGLGNWMALLPLAIKTLFDPRLFAMLYGRLFTAYGVAAILGTLFSGAILDLTNATWPIYAFVVIANLFNVIVMLNIKKRHHIKVF